jgi:DNA mismatch repair protein MSH3
MKPNQKKISAFFARKPAGQTASVSVPSPAPAPTHDQSQIQQPAKRRRVEQSETLREIPSDVELAALARRKLVDGDAAENADAAPHSVSTRAKPQKLTPLEQQVVRLKEKHPGVLLVVEVRSTGPQHQ